MKHLRKRLTYANVMSSIAVFLVIGGATAIAANLPPNSVGTPQLKKNAVKTGKVAFEAIRAGKLSKNAVPTNRLRNSAVSNEKIANGAVTTDKLGDNAVTEGKIANDAVTTDKIANDAVTGDKVKESTLGQVPSAVNAVNAVNAAALGGIAAANYAQRMFARVSYTTATESLIAASPGISVTTEGSLGFPRLVFPRSMDACAIVGSANSNTGTQIFRRSSNSSGSIIQFALKDENGAAVRSDFEIIAVC